jgi:trans-aconitate 2-methyltransferase
VSSSRDWDAQTYDRVSDPQFGWAIEQLERLPLRGDEVVLDAGCGSGRVTAELVRRLQPDDPGAAQEGEAGCRAGRRPGGRVYGVDAAPSMVKRAREALGDRATVYCQDLVELSLPEPVDAVFSNATFHWIPDHDALFAALHRAMRPGGRLVAQCGGFGNIDSFLRAADSVAAEEPFAHCFVDWKRPWNYATPEETEQRLQRAGFTEVECWLEPRPTTLKEPRPFVETVCLVRHLDPLPGELRGPFIDRVLKRVGEPLVLEYVRLNMLAHRA